MYKKSFFILTAFLFLLISCENKSKDSESLENKQIDVEEALFTDMEKEAREKNKPKPTYKYWNGLEDYYKLTFENEYRNTKSKRKVFEKFYDDVGPDAFLDYVEQKYPYCHSQAHDLGKTVFAKTLDFNKALNICGNRCTNGCMHGVVAEAMGKSEYKNIMKSVNSLCGEIPGDFKTENFDEAGAAMNEFCSTGEISKLHKKGNCAHAMGHALMMMSDNNLSQSVKGCKGFPEEAMGYYCATGVYMEYGINIYNKIIEKEDFNRPSDHYPCDTIKDYPAACYRYTLPLIAYERKAKLKNIVKICEELEGPQRTGCFHGLGSAITRTITKNPDILKLVCSNGNEDEQTVCIEGALEKLADYSEQQAIDICNTLSGKMKEVCLASAEGKMYRMDKPSLDLYCQ